MRILLVAHGFPPQACGGAEIHVHDLARCLSARADDDVHVLAREADPARPELAVRRERRGRLTITWVNNTYRDVAAFADTYRHPRLGAALARIVDEVRPDVAHVHHLTNLSTDLVFALRRRGVPVVMTLHDFWLICQRGQLLDRDARRCPGPSPAGCARCLGLAASAGAGRYAGRRLVEAVAPRLPAAVARALRGSAAWLAPRLGGPGAAESAIARRLAHVRALCAEVQLFIAPSRTVQQRFVALGVPPARIRRLPYGHDHGRFAGLARPPSRTLRLGFMGTLMVSKAPHLLLEAFAGLPPGAATVQLFGRVSAYHGDDRYRHVLEPLLAQPGVAAPRALPHDAIPAALAALDVLVVPSIWLENAPLVISEAFLAGVPVVCADLGGMAEMVAHEVNGLRFRPGDAQDLRRQLQRLIAEPALLPRLRAGLPPVARIEDTAAELRRCYGDLGGAREGRRALGAVIVNYRTPDRTVACARALAASARAVDALVVVENGSHDGSAGRLARELPGVRHLVLDVNRGFAGGTNAGMRAALAAGAELILLVNSDAMLDPDCVGRLEGALRADPRLGIVGPAVTGGADPARLESAGIAWSPLTGRMRLLGSGRRCDARAGRGPRPVDAVSGCVMLLRREVLEQLGGFDEDYFFSFEDLDLCLRARQAGWLTACVTDARAVHEGSASIGRRQAARLYFAARNHLRLAARVPPARRGLRLLRATSIVALNLAHALLTSESSRLAGLRATVRGIRHHLQGRYGGAG